MKLLKKMIAALTVCSILLLAGACSKTQSGANASSKASGNSQKGEEKQAKGLSLPINESDSLNPFTAKSKHNQELSLLLFDSLVYLNEVFEVENGLAESISKAGKNLTIQLKSAFFSDGTKVTAEDVTYSMGLAAASPKYSSRLAAVAGKSAAGASTLTVTMKKDDPNFAALLEFPVIKMNSEKVKDKDNKEVPPIGSGRYTFVKESANLYLKPNEKFRSPVSQQISLVSTPDDDALAHNIQSGSVSLYYSDLSDLQFSGMNGRAYKVPTNNLVFLGINSKSGVLSQQELRSAVSNAIDRSQIAESAYLSYAQAAESPFNPLWEKGRPDQISLPASAKSNFAVADLEKAGYNKNDSDDRFSKDKKNLSLKLVVNKENTHRVKAAELIKEQLEKTGISVNITSLSFADYSAAVTAGAYDLVLSEIKLLNNMDLSSLILTGSFVPFFPENSLSPGEYSKYLTGEVTLSQFVDMFNTELLFIPVCYRFGILNTVTELESPLQPGVFDIFRGI